MQNQKQPTPLYHALCFTTKNLKEKGKNRIQGEKFIKRALYHSFSTPAQDCNDNIT